MDGEGSIAFGQRDTARMILRPLLATDRAAHVRFFSESREHLRRWSPAMPDMTPEQFFDRQLERCEKGMRDGTALRLIGFDRAAGAIAGTFNLNNLVRGVFDNADAGWAVGKEFIGRGYATEGVLALLDIAFGAAEASGLDLHRVSANVIPANSASMRVAEKCGFRMEGIGRAMLKIAGEWQDHVMHAKLASEHRAGD